MQKLQLSAEKVHLLQKVAKKEKDPLEILFCTLVAVFLFLYVYYLVGFKFRHEEWFWAMVLGPGLVLVLCIWLTHQSYKRINQAHHLSVGHSLPGQRRNLFLNLTVCAWAALLVGFYLGDQTYWKYTTNIWSYRDLVSYIDIDPSRDNGQSYMDSGHLYFKEHAYVLRQRFNKFRNGDTYCVAPIIKGSFKPQPGSNVRTMNGYTLPESGTYDWWAVGTNCCDGDQAANFTCGEVENPLSRSGMRLLSDTQRPYYLLAVQEWSATYGLPVKHPLFFTWVKDPLETEDTLYNESHDEMITAMWWFLLCVFIFSFLLHMLLHRNKIY